MPKTLGLLRLSVGITVAVTVLLTSACTPAAEILSRDPAPVSFSEDAVVFDTVFTAEPTITQWFHVRNPNRNAVLIRAVRLGNPDSPFLVTVGGRPLRAAQDISLRGGDSLQVLVSLRIPPRDSTEAFVLFDSLMFEMPNATPNIKLLAWGRDAVPIRQRVLNCNQTWQAGKPYIIYDTVQVPAGCRLTLQPGTQVYAFNRAVLLVEGTLQVQGTAENPVVFGGFRQDGPYREAPGLWNGLVFRRASRQNQLNFLQIRNATNAIYVETNPDQDDEPEVTVSNTIIQYARQSGVLAVGSDVRATNLRITHCGEFHYAALGGGSHRLWHCTIVGEPYLFQRDNPALLFSGSVELNGTTRRGEVVAQVANTVVWGVLPNEVGLLQNNAGGFFDAQFSHNLLKTPPASVVTFGATNLLGSPPRFTDPRRFDYTPAVGSPLLGQGTNLGVPTDLNGKPRGPQPSIGAYER